MNLNKFASILRMMGWKPIGGGYMWPPEQYNNNSAILLVSDTEVLIGDGQAYCTPDEALTYIMEHTNE